MHIGRRVLKLKNKEVLDALCMLLHCSLLDKEMETQRSQFFLIYNYIRKLENAISTSIHIIDEKYFITYPERDYVVYDGDKNIIHKGKWKSMKIGKYPDSVPMYYVYSKLKEVENDNN